MSSVSTLEKWLRYKISRMHYAPPCIQVSPTHLEVVHQKMRTTDAPTSNQFQWLDLMIGHQHSTPSNGHQGYSDSKDYGANMGPTWVLSAPDGLHVDPMNFAIRVHVLLAWIVIFRAQGAVSIRKTVLPGMAIPMLKIRRPNSRLIFNMEIAIRR